MSVEQNIAAVKTLTKVLNTKKVGDLSSFFSSDLVDHSLRQGLPTNIEGRKMLLSSFFAAFPDLEVRVEDTIAAGDKVTTRWSATGTHKGDFVGVPATGKQVTITGIAIDRFQDGKSVEHWEELDQVGLMVQLGAIPAPGQG